MNKEEMIQLPAQFSFSDVSEADAIQAEQGGKSSAKLPTFHIVANTGARMQMYCGDVVIDLNGVKSKAEQIPILFGHNAYSAGAGIGHTTKIAVEDGAIAIDGVVSRDTDVAREFVESSKRGFPWQASVGGFITKKTTVDKGQSVTVNGREEKGPLIVANEFELWETSVVTFGADGNTSAKVNAASNVTLGKGQEMEEQKKQVDAENKVEEQIDVQAELNKLREEQAKEFERIAEIRARAQENDGELVAQAIREGWTPDKFELASLRANRAPAPSIKTQDDKLNAKALEAAALRASGLLNESKYDEQTLEVSDKYANVGFQEFCEIACGHSLPRYQRDPSGWLHAAFSTQNLSYVLTRSFNAILLEAFYYTESEWRKVFNIGRVRDFKTYDRYRMNPVDFTFEPLTDGGKYKHAELSDSAYSVQAETFGKMYAITRRDIINDDMGVFTDIPRMIGFGASETLNQYCWAKFLNPATDADGKAFYHADHGNLKTSCALTLDNLSAARAQFIKQKKAKGGEKTTGESPLGIEPKLLVVPTELEDKALMLTKATWFNNGSTADTPADYNPQRNRWTVAATSFLSNSSFTGYSASTWYLFADPRRLAAFEVSFLNGKDKPTIERADADFDTDGIQFKGYLDFGISQQDYRAAMKCTA